MIIVRPIILLTILAAPLVTHAQDLSSDYFKKGEEYLKHEEYAEAIRSYGYITAIHPRSEFYAQSLYGLGASYYKNDQPDSAIAALKKILALTNKNKKSKQIDRYRLTTSDLKHDAASLLSNIYLATNNPDSALRYLGISDSVYRFRHFCGNAYASNDIRLALKYAAIYQKQGKNDQAIQALLPQVFESQLADNSELLTKLYTLIESKSAFKQELDNALELITVKAINNTTKEDIIYTLKFHGVTFDISGGYNNAGNLASKEDIILHIKQTKFYNTISM